MRVRELKSGRVSSINFDFSRFIFGINLHDNFHTLLNIEKRCFRATRLRTFSTTVMQIHANRTLNICTERIKKTSISTARSRVNTCVQLPPSPIHVVFFMTIANEPKSWKIINRIRVNCSNVYSETSKQRTLSVPEFSSAFRRYSY